MKILMGAHFSSTIGAKGFQNDAVGAFWFPNQRGPRWARAPPPGAPPSPPSPQSPCGDSCVVRAQWRSSAALLGGRSVACSQRFLPVFISTPKSPVDRRKLLKSGLRGLCQKLPPFVKMPPGKNAASTYKKESELKARSTPFTGNFHCFSCKLPVHFEVRYSSAVESWFFSIIMARHCGCYGLLLYSYLSAFAVPELF